MSEIKYQKLDTLLKYLKKSKIKAGEGKKEGKYPFFKSGADQSKFIDISTFEGDSLIIGDGGNANINYFNGKFSTSDHCYVIQKKDDEDIDIKYVYYFLKTNMQILEAGFKGAGLKNISKKYISNIKIPIQSLENQRKISAFLTRLEELIEKREESIKLLDELIKNTFLDMFGDPYNNKKKYKITTIKHLITEAKYGTSSPANNKGKYPYLRMGNITYSGFWDFNDLKYIDISNQDKYKYLLKRGDIVFNRTNSKELVGKTAVYDQDEEMIIAGYLIRMRVKENINPWFIWGYLNSKIGKIVIYNLCRNIVGMANINAQELQKIKILLPPKPLQDKFANIVTKIENTKKLYQDSLDELTNLFNSTAQKAFRGELDVSKIELEQTQQKEAVMKLDKEQILELIKQGNFDPKDYVTSESSYDDIRDMIIGAKDKIGLIDDGLVVQEFDEELKKIVLKVKE